MCIPVALLSLPDIVVASFKGEILGVGFCPFQIIYNSFKLVC
jgi:hypothetical protein